MPPRSRRRRSKMKKSRRRSRRLLSGGRTRSKSKSFGRWSSARVTAAALGAAAGASYLLYTQRNRAAVDSLLPHHHMNRPPLSKPVTYKPFSREDYNLYESPLPAPPNFVSDVTDKNYRDKILFLIHMTDLEGTRPLFQRPSKRPFYLTLVTTDNIDYLFRFQIKPRMMVFSKELLFNRIDYVVNTRDIGPGSQNQNHIQIYPLFTYFPSELIDVVRAIEKDKHTFLRRSQLAFHEDLIWFMFNEVIFVDPILWEESSIQCCTEVIIDDTNLDATWLINETNMRRTFPKIKFDNPTDTLVKNLNFLVELKKIQKSITDNSLTLPTCTNTLTSTLPIYSYQNRSLRHHMIQYAEQQLHVLCASRTAPAHYACDAAHQMSKNNPTLTNKITAWKELVGRLNDPSKQDSEKEPIYEKLIADGKEYRRLHFDEFEELEKTDKLNSFLFMFRDQAWRER
jgi:hypothetical protein